jgi:hypothetical protein
MLTMKEVREELLEMKTTVETLASKIEIALNLMESFFMVNAIDGGQPRCEDDNRTEDVRTSRVRSLPFDTEPIFRSHGPLAENLPSPNRQLDIPHQIQQAIPQASCARTKRLNREVNTADDHGIRSRPDEEWTPVRRSAFSQTPSSSCCSWK